MKATARRAIVAASLVCLVCLPSWSALSHPDWISAGNTADRSWAHGPVWYVMTHVEYGAYRRLRTDTERQTFIRKFWSLRDPLPETPENELEREFWRRVVTADGNFGQEIKPGWKTERGKVYIMLGPPANAEEDQILADRTRASRWVYDLRGMSPTLRGVLSDTLGIPEDRPIVKIEVREETEGTRSVGGAFPTQTSVLRPTASLPLAETLVRRMGGRLGALRELGQVMRVPEAIVPPVQVHVSTVFTHVPVQARVDFRPGAGSAAGRRTAVAITVGVAAKDLEAAGAHSIDPDMSVLTGHLTSADEPRRRYALSGVFSADPRPDAARHTFQAVSQVPPGRYVLDIAYEDLGERVMGALRDVIEVPDFGEPGLSLSSMILADRLERVEDSPQTAPSDGAPFTFGPYRVIPRTSAAYTQPDELLVFYRAYGAYRDDHGLPRLDVSYQFYVEDAGAWLPVGSPIDVDASTEVEQAWGIPLAGWAPGNYRLEVTVADRLAGTASMRGAHFTIEPSGQPAP